MVFHADIRDTIFQKDIFKIYENNHRFIGLSLENANISERINADWMKRQYGKEIYEELKDKQVINSGVIWGTTKEFYELVKNIWNEIEAKSPYENWVQDQTATNYIIYHKKILNDCIIKNNMKTGPVIVVGFANPSVNNFTFDKEYNLLNFNKDDIAAVVHNIIDFLY